MDFESHTGASEFCQGWGGELASITDEVENMHIYRLLNNKEDYWIGLYKNED